MEKNESTAPPSSYSNANSSPTGCASKNFDTPSPPSSNGGPPSPVFTVEKFRSNFFGTLIHGLLVYWIIIFTIVLIFLTYFQPQFYVGFAWGIFVSILFLRYSLAVFLPIDRSKVGATGEEIVTDAQQTLEQLAEQTTLDKSIYKGWMNVLWGKYDPYTYHLAQVTCALIRLDGELLRISIPKTSKISKHSFWTEPRYEPSNFVKQEMYNIVGSKVFLRPVKLARRRWFVRKYPICLYILNENRIFDGTEKEPHESNGSMTAASELSTSSSNDWDDQEEFASTSTATAVPVKSASSDQLTALAAKKAIAKQSRKTYRKLYLFARNCREKEQWFHKLRMASGQLSYLKQKGRDDSPTGYKSDSELPNIKYSEQILDWILYTSVLKQFFSRMSAVNVMEAAEQADSQNLYNMQLNSQIWKSKDRLDARATSSKENIIWLNAVFSRIFMDCAKDPYWIKHIKEKVEMKLATIKLPYFIDTLKLAKLDPGSTAPRISGIHQPTVNDWGLWFDLDIEYFGEFCLALETKINLMRLKTDKHKKSPVIKEDTPSRYWDEDVPQSPESSEDEADKGVSLFNKDLKQEAPKEKPRQGRVFMNLVDKITRSRYFQEATENKYIKKLMQDVSETPFMLLVDFIYLEGTLAVNIPPPPSDRIWYGFRFPPKISIKARPRVGDRSLSLSHIIDWIENRLLSVFEKNLIIPNMDDMVVPLIAGSPLMKKVNL